MEFARRRHGGGAGSATGRRGVVQGAATGRDDEAVRRVIERFALDLADAGMPRMPARVFAAILSAEDGRCTAAELAQLLGVSPAAVSGAGRYLLQVRICRGEREPGARPHRPPPPPPAPARAGGTPASSSPSPASSWPGCCTTGASGARFPEPPLPGGPPAAAAGAGQGGEPGPAVAGGEGGQGVEQVA